MKVIIIIITIFISSLNASIAKEKHKPETLTNDGAWCWFSAPRAIYRHVDKKEIVTGWVTKDGSIEAAILNLESGEKSIQNLNPKLDKDDHANPSFVELENKEIIVSYTKHSDKFVRFHTLAKDKQKAEFDIERQFTPFNEEQFKLYPRKKVTYTNPFSLSSESGRIYCFGRWTGFKPNLTWSDDMGKTFSPAKVFITNKPFDAGNRPYVIYYSDGKSKIHIVFTDGHPRNEPLNSVYYACYENGAFWRIDGSKICDLENIPFEPKDASIVYKATEQNGRAWVYDVVTDKKGNPAILYARYPEETKHLYHYTIFNGKKWIDNEICNSGKWFPQTIEGTIEKEPHYSAGMTFNPLNPNTIYLSRNVKGIFEIEKRVTKNNGKSWSITPITQNSKYDNVRPIVPKNMQKGDPVVLLWMENEKYIHYINYNTRIKYLIED